MPSIAAAIFGVGSFGSAGFVVVPQLLLLYYLTDTVSVPASSAGLALLLPKLWEFFTDPGIGVLSDSSRSRFGHRRPFMLAGALLLPLGLAAVFAVPAFPSWAARLVFATVAFSIATTGYSLFAVPYVAMIGELTDDPHDRTRLVAWRMAFLSLGILASGGVAPWLVKSAGGGRHGYAVMGLALAAACSAAMLCTVIGSRECRRGPAGGASLRSQLARVLRAADFRALGAGYFLQMMGVGLNVAMLPYAAAYRLGAGPSVVGEIYGVFTLASLAAIPATGAVARRIGKRRALAAAAVFYALSLMPLAAAGPRIAWLVWVCFVSMGVSSAGVQVFAFALLPDVIDDAAGEADAARAGVFTGVWIAGEKLGLALGAALGGVGISVAGYVAGASSQSASARLGIALLFSLAPAILMLASLAPLSLMRPARLS